MVPGVSLFKSKLVAENWFGDGDVEPYNVWRVDMEGLTVEEDPSDPTHRVCVREGVGSGRMTHVGTYVRGEPVQT